jgi:protein-tyrosine phosphatase
MQKMSKIRNVLFLCSGNVCRSIAAEFYAKWLKNTSFKEELQDLKFDSAGIRHYFETPHEGTIRYLKSKGIDTDGITPKDITEEMINKQDLILAFEEKYHIRRLKRKFKYIKNLDEKVFLLLEFAGEAENLEIEDPFYMEESEYNKIIRRIEDGINKSIEKIIEINRTKE